MSSKKVCINCPTSFYTGKEQSPLHFGLSAEGYELNAIMEGFDDELWIVEIKNNKKVWTKKEHINKLTYEKPVINDTLKSASNDTFANTDNVAGNGNANGKGNANGNANGNAVNNQIDVSENSNTIINNDSSKNSKTNKPTDYTLFITYRINQMKKESNDNKKNYDCAREEWKEYKKKPEELNAIMIDVNNFSKTICKLNKN